MLSKGTVHLIDIIKMLDKCASIDIDTPKHIKLPLDFFSIPEIKALDNYPEQDRLIASWIELVLFAAKLDNGGKLQVKSNSPMRKKSNALDTSNHLFSVSVAFLIKIDKSKEVEKEREFALRAVDIFFKEGLLRRIDNLKEP